MYFEHLFRVFKEKERNMATKEFFTDSEELKKLMSAARATITAPFFGNNVEEVKTVSEAYKLAKNR